MNHRKFIKLNVNTDIAASNKSIEAKNEITLNVCTGHINSKILATIKVKKYFDYTNNEWKFTLRINDALIVENKWTDDNGQPNQFIKEVQHVTPKIIEGLTTIKNEIQSNESTRN